MAVREYGGEITEEDFATGRYPQSKYLISQGYTYEPGIGWQPPQETPSAASVWGAPAAEAAPDFSGYAQFGAEPTTKKFTPTSGLPRAGGTTGGLTYRRPTGQIQRTKTVFAGERPTLDLPERSAARVKALTRKALAPRLRNLRSALNRALVRSYENPNVRRMITREALQGYGAGVEEATYGAERTAEAQEAAERATQIQEALANYQGAMQAFLGSGQKVTQAKYTYGGEGGVFGAPTSKTTFRGGFALPMSVSVPTIWGPKPPEEEFEF